MKNGKKVLAIVWTKKCVFWEFLTNSGLTDDKLLWSTDAISLVGCQQFCLGSFHGESFNDHLCDHPLVWCGFWIVRCIHCFYKLNLYQHNSFARQSWHPALMSDPPQNHFVSKVLCVFDSECQPTPTTKWKFENRFCLRGKHENKFSLFCTGKVFLCF